MDVQTVIGLLVVAVAVGLVLLAATRRGTLPSGGREPLDLGIALRRLARDGRGLTPGQGERPPHVRRV